MFALNVGVRSPLSIYFHWLRESNYHYGYVLCEEGLSKMFQVEKVWLCLLFLPAFIVTTVEAHSGRTNSSGCHGGSRPYHCHGGYSSNKGRKSTTRANSSSTRQSSTTQRSSDSIQKPRALINVDIENTNISVNNGGASQVVWEEQGQASARRSDKSMEAIEGTHRWVYTSRVASVGNASGLQLSYDCNAQFFFFHNMLDKSAKLFIDGNFHEATYVPIPNRLAVNATDSILRSMRAGRELVLVDSDGVSNMFSLMGFTAASSKMITENDCTVTR